MRVSEIFPNPKSASAKRLVQLAIRAEELRTEVGGLRTQASADNEHEVQAKREVLDAEAEEHAWGNAADQVKTARSKLARIQKQAGERAEAIQIATNAAETVNRQLRAYAADHSKQLWMELSEDNAAVAQRLGATIEAFSQAYTDQTQAGVRATELLRLTDAERLRAERIPDVPAPVAEFARHAATVADGVPVPLPSTPGTIAGVETAAA